MRQLTCLLVVFALAACGDNGDAPIDARIDAPRVDAPAIDAPTDTASSSGIAEARAATDGTGLTLPISNVTVTYLKPALGNLINDPAGFTIQSDPTGPALFVSVDPTTLSPPAAVGDVVSFTITTMGTIGLQRRAQAITSYARASTGANVAALVQDVSAATDLVTTEDMYDSELVTITGTVFESRATSGTAFERVGLTTAGITGNTNLQLRGPTTLFDSVDIAMGCTVTATRLPVGRFNAQTQLTAFAASELALSTCPAPTVVSAVALSPTSVRVTFSRNILASSVLANGSQFTFDNGLTASAAAVSDRSVTLTTTAQTGGATYTVTVASTVTDLLGTALGAPATAMFLGYLTPAVVRINEVNANVTGGCDLIELRVISGGSMTGYTLTERLGGTGELAFTFPAFVVQTNDLIVVHTGSGSATCNPGTATQETTSPTQQPTATYGANFDTAYDFWSPDTGLTSTDNVFTLSSGTPAIIDVLFASDDAAGTTAAAATETAAATAGAANQWSPMLATYLDAVFRTNAADDLNATGTSAAGTSLQRLDNTDDNDKADWTTGAGAASTWGALNAGQTAI